jgi:hypothetical protein
MPTRMSRISVSLVLFLLLSTCLATSAFAQESNAQGAPSTYFAPGNLVVSVEGCGVNGGTCTAVPNGTGNGAGNSSVTGYGDNQAAPLTLFQYTPSGTFVNALVFPQTGSGANLPVSGEYGSSSEAAVQLSGTGQYLTIMGYGVNANAFNADPSLYGIPGGELAQSGSLTGQAYTPIARVVALVDAYGNVNSSTNLLNAFNENNPRSAYTLDGINIYVSGQGTGCDLTGGVLLTSLGTTNTAPTAITGGDAKPTTSCVASGYAGTLVAQDTRTVQIYGNTLYISIDSTEGKSDNRSLIGTLGTPPATSLFTPTNPPTGDTGGPDQINGLGNTGGTGKEAITTGGNSNGNGLNAGLQINISPDNYFFASPSVLYVADSGSPKQSSATSSLGDGGLQKWVNSASNGSGAWSLKYTLYKGLNLVANTSAAGTTGLLGLAGTVSGGTAYLYATNYTIGDLDPTYLYAITDTLTTATNPGTTFTQLAAAPQDSNFKGVSLAPTLPAGSATITSTPSGLAVTTSGTGCAPGTYTTPVTLTWTSGNPCSLSVVSPQTAAGTQYVFNEWQDGTTVTTDAVTAPATSAVYSASFKAVPVVTWPAAASAITYGQTLNSSALSGGSASVTGSFAFTAPSTVPAAGTAAQSVTFTPSDTTNYATVTTTISVTVNKAPLTVTANNASRAVGAANPAFTASYSGFVNGETSAVLGGSPSLTTTATTSSPAGTYPITAVLGTLTAANYTFAFVNGTLSVVAAPPVSITPSASLTGSHSAGYTLTITIQNPGTSAMSNLVLTAATLGTTSGSPLPQPWGTLGAGGTAVFTVNFPGSVGVDGAGVAEKYSGTYTGGTFAASLRSVTLP